jgi:CRISPR-associated protein Cmr3
MWVEFKAFDSLFFRDAKPFGKGSEFRAASVFPPPASVLRGALRTAYFTRHMDEFAEFTRHTEDLTYDPTGGLTVRAVFLKDRRGVRIPLPLNFAVHKTIQNLAYVMKPVKSPAISSYRLPYALHTEIAETTEASGDTFIYFKEYDSCLRGEPKAEFYYNRLSEFVTHEIKTGIEIDSGTGTAQESMLYQTEFVRPVNKHGDAVTVLADVHEIDGMPEKGIVRLGGEGKTAFYEETENPFEAVPPEIGRHFSLTLLSPAIFKTGWLPGFIDGETFTGRAGGLTLRLIAAAAGRPVSISGFDMRVKKQKKLYHAVPVGSVYYFEITDGNGAEAVERFHWRGIGEVNENDCCGLSIVGRYSL